MAMEEGSGGRGLDRATNERKALKDALSDYDTPVGWLRGREGIALAKELLELAKEPQGAMESNAYEERVKGRAMEVLALHERPGPETGETREEGGTG
jgi:hypothetical protein